jgi:hypothetical protein
MPSEPPAPPRAPRADRSRGRRLTLVGMGAVASIGIAAVAVVGLRHTDEPGSAPVAMPTDAEPLIGDVAPAVVDAAPILTQDAAPVVAVDAAPRERDAGAARDAAPRAVPALVQNADRSYTIPLRDRGAFDPLAFTRTASAAVTEVTGGDAVLYHANWRAFDRRGRIDTTGEGSAIYHFIAGKLAEAKQGCVVTVEVQAGKATLSIANECTAGVWRFTPSCTLEQLWTKALAMGAPADATRANVNRTSRRTWQFSTGEWSEPIDDDCRAER